MVGKKFVIGALILCLALAAACAASDQKKKYKVNAQTPSEYLTSAGAAGVAPEWDPTGCQLPAVFDGPAIDYLQALVSLGNRRSGTLEYRCASRYVARVLGELGYTVEEQEYGFPFYEFDPAAFKVIRQKDGKEYRAYPLHYSAPLGDRRSGRLIRPGRRQDLSGAFIYCGLSQVMRKDFRKKTEEWKKQGALGIVREADMRPEAVHGVLHSAHFHASSYYYGPLPGVIVEHAAELLGETIEVQGQARIVKGHGYDVIGRGPSTGGKAVLVTAHLDSWFEGALDDGSGIAAMLEVARLLKDQPQNLIFLAADSEELGLFGSADYALEHGVAEVGAVVELDMVSSTNNFGHKPPAEAGPMPRLVRATKGLLPLARKSYSGLGGLNVFLPIGIATGPKGSLRTDMEWYWRQGVPGVVVYVPSYYYHTTRDTREWIPGPDLNAFAVDTAGLTRELRSEIGSLPAPAKVVAFEFTVSPAAGDTVAFTVKPARPEAARLGLMKAKVLAWYEFGYEDEVVLKAGKDGTFSGEFRLPRPGAWYFEAVVTDPRAGGKKWVKLSR